MTGNALISSENWDTYLHTIAFSMELSRIIELLFMFCQHSFPKCPGYWTDSSRAFGAESPHQTDWFC